MSSHIVRCWCLWLLLLLIALCVTGCGGGDIAIRPGNQPVTLQLNWTPDPTFTGEYLAKHRDFWRNTGLAVTIQAGGFGIDPIAAVVSKKAQFAVVGADKAAIAHANGAPIRVVAVDFQRNPVGWIARSHLKVVSFRDLVGRKDVILGDKVGTETTAILSIVLRRLQLDKQLSPKGVGFDFGYFVEKPNVVYPVYLNEEPVRAELAGIPIIEIDPADKANGGVRLYGNVIITHRDFLKENAPAVTAFTTGLRRGWEYARDNEDDAVTLLKARVKEFDPKSLTGVLKRSVGFATNYYGTEVQPGHMEVEAWQNTLDTLKEGGVLKKDIRVEDLVWMGGK